MIKTFRGRVADNGKTQVRLSTKQGLVGYKIKKFQGISYEIATSTEAHVFKVYSVNPSTVTGTVNFDSPTLLAVCYFTNRSDELQNNMNIIIFDDKIINQDIYITHVDVQASAQANFYLELEQVKLDINEATVATLKDMRGNQ